MHFHGVAEVHILLLAIVAFIVVFVLYTGNSIRYRFGGKKLPLPLWRLSITRVALIAACVVVVAVTISYGYFVVAVILAFVFAFLAWMAGRDVVVEKRDRLTSLYRALARADSGNSNKPRLAGGPVGRWAAGLREADYARLAHTVADATDVSDATADDRLRDVYDRSVSSDERV